MLLTDAMRLPAWVFWIERFATGGTVLPVLDLLPVAHLETVATEHLVSLNHRPGRVPSASVIYLDNMATVRESRYPGG